ncbi:MAG TPA: hypothetical protein DD706_04425 [Nitrospiraceae bacterium]|nr:hypothetical protein [Nitrospiraceae bacterium]
MATNSGGSRRYRKSTPKRRRTNHGICSFEIRSAGNVDLIKSLQDHILGKLGRIANSRKIEIVPSLPKTRSGKIMRRILKAKELGQDPVDNSTEEMNT